MEFLEYSKEYDMNSDEVFIFHPIGTTEPTYETKIVIDWLNMDLEESGLVARYSCSCKDHLIRKRKCKHITEAIKILKKRGYKLREEKLERYFCHICKLGIDTVEYNLTCGYCGNKLVKPNQNV